VWARLYRQQGAAGLNARAARTLVLSAPAVQALARLVDHSGFAQARSAANWVGNLCDPVNITGGTRRILESHQTDSVRVNELC